VEWYRSIVELIDMRSFSNLWFWIVLAVVWSSASHWVLGVPYDMVLRARRRGGQAQADLEALVRVTVNRLLYIGQVAGLALIVLVSFGLSMLAVLGFLYRIEFCQAVFLIALPMSIVSVLSMRAARRLDVDGVTGEELHHRLRRHRVTIQAIGMVAIFVTAMWGMWQNLNSSALGG
jgi:hypothetical protein